METNHNENEIESAEVTSFFSASTSKLVIMSICTLNVYLLYWMYKNFQHIQNTKEGYDDIMPFWRAFFGTLWAYSCFSHIQDACDEKDLKLDLAAAFFAILYFILQFGTYLAEPLLLLTLLLTSSCFILANNATTALNQLDNSEFVQNSKLKGWNWLAVILGGLVAILLFLGMFLPEPPPL